MKNVALHIDYKASFLNYVNKAMFKIENKKEIKYQIIQYYPVISVRYFYYIIAGQLTFILVFSSW